MKTRQTKSADANAKPKKATAGSSGPALSKKLRYRKHGETSKGVQDGQLQYIARQMSLS